MATPVSIFSQTGVDVGSNSRSVAYLMGLSDFFHSVFQDKDTINLLLEAGAISASDTYSKFLQLTSTLSLETIQTFTGTSLKLLFLSTADQLAPNVYKIDKSIVGSSYLSNRPYLPTEILEKDIQFSIEPGTEYSTLTLSKDISEFQFSQRTVSEGQTEYAVWVVDAIIDGNMMQEYFGSWVAAEPEASSEQFSNFVYGLYYLYSNGPTLDAMEKGANLALGIPLARDNETVIDIRTYLDTDQYLVITDKNQYVLPEGIPAIVYIGQNISIGDSLAKVVELKDYRADGQWWVNVAIPKTIIQEQPKSQVSRFANSGTFFFTIMRDYLFRHTFLVRINVGEFRNNDYFAKMFAVINRAKPSYTQPIYTWRVYLGEDEGSFSIEESAFSMTTPAGFLYAINFHAINEDALG